MSTTPMTTPSEIWKKILKGDVEKDDPLWKEYLDKAAVFDARLVDELNKIVDVLLVYVALFIATLTSFILQANTQLKRDPADITNDLLKAMYLQMIAQSNNTSIPPADPNSFFQQSKSDHDAAVIQNAILYTSLSLCIIVSVISLVSKLWLVNYNHQAFSVGSPYERAMKRQEAYNGVLVWNLRGVINTLPVILLISLLLFEIYVFISISAAQNMIGGIVAVLFNLSLLFLGFTSLGGAIFPGCPFRSTFSSVIRFTFEKPQMFLTWILLHGRLLSGWARTLWYYILLSLSILMLNYSLSSSIGIWLSLHFLITFGGPLEYFATWEAVHKPQKYRISQLALWFLLSSSVGFILVFYNRRRPGGGGILITVVIVLLEMVIFESPFIIYASISKSMADTGEIDAIAWLLKTAPPQNPAVFFKKVGQMTGFDSIGSRYRPRLLESLLPFLSLLIISHHVSENPSSSESDIHSPSFNDEDPHLKLENLEIYTACLARLSEFTDSKGSFMCLWEDAMQHPKLEQPLIDKLVVIANPQHRLGDGLRSAATKILINYNLDMKGKSAGGPDTIVRRNGVTAILRNAVSSVTTFLGSAASRMLNVSGLIKERPRHTNSPVELENVEPPHSSGDIEEA